MSQTYDQPQLDVIMPSPSADGAERAARADNRTYYGLPMIKAPTWSWTIPVYFWLGGVAGGAAVVGAVADLFGGEEYRTTVRNARWLALAIGAVCPLPLIQDLGRPERFYNMLRVFKVSSPLNIGTWILTGFGGVSGIAAARQAAEDGFIISRESSLGRVLRVVPSAPISAVHGLLGMALGGYTGIVLTSTAVPLWASGGVLLGPLFESTAVASGAAALNVIGIASGQDTDAARRGVDTIEAAGQVAQLSAMMGHELTTRGRSGKPLRRGLWGTMYRVGAVGAGVAAPLALRLGAKLRGTRPGKALYATAATLSLAGALIERLALVEAGKVSARDPLAYQEVTRGAPGDARPTPQQQAHQAPATPAYNEHVAVSDHVL